MKHRELYRRSIRVGSLILFLTLASAFAFGESIVLISHGAGTFDYGLSVPSGSRVDFFTGQNFSLTGLSGVTGATVSGGFLPCFTASFTSSSVTVTQTIPNTSCGFIGPTTVSTLEVSSLAPLGTVDFAIQVAQGNFSGAVGGPAVPEPSSLLDIFGSGAFASLGLMFNGRLRQKLFRR